MTEREFQKQLKEYHSTGNMTVELATKLLSECGLECMYDDETKVALDMAIQALSARAKTGHWIVTIEDWSKWTCSECGFSKRTDIHVRLGYKYCPNCGAKMERRNKE